MTVVISGLQSRRERKKIRTRAQIVNAAIRLFTQQGIEAVTVDQIAVAADVGKGTIYNYFRAKEDIIVAFMVDFERRVQARLRNFQSGQRSAAGVLIDFVQTQFRLKRRHHAFVRVFLGHMFLHTEQFLPYMVAMQQAIDPPLEALFGELQRRGAIRDDVEVSELILVFKTVQLGLTALWALEGPPFQQVARVVEQQMMLFCKGLEVAK